MTVVDTVTGEVVTDLTAEQARLLTDEIRTTLRTGHELIIKAFSGRAWAVLGYVSWDAYCAGEFAEARMVRLDREQRKEIAAEMHDAGMSNRAIASGIGVDPQTVANDFKSRAESSARAPAPKVQGSDGKAYPWSEPKPTAEPAAPKAANRRALTDQFFDAATDLTRVADRIARLAADDRFTRNANEIATSYRSDLVRAVDAVQGVINRLS